MGEDSRAALSFKDYCQLKHNDKGKGARGSCTQNSKFQCTIGRMYLPTFDGSSKCTVRASVEKLDRYFQLH